MMLLFVIILSILFIQSTYGGAVIKASFQACPGSCGTIWYRPDYCRGNPVNTPPSTYDIISILAWTWNTAREDPCPFGKSRALLRFDQMTDVIPSSAIVTSATLKLIGAGPRQDYPQAFSYFPNSPHAIYAPDHYDTNRVNITRATSAYTMSTVTWNTQPSTAGPPAVIPESNVPFYYNVAIDVKSLVQEMIAPKANNGFVLELEVEDYYRSMNFFSCNAIDCATRPLLEVEYILPCNQEPVKTDNPVVSIIDGNTDTKFPESRI